MFPSAGSRWHAVLVSWDRACIKTNSSFDVSNFNAVSTRKRFESTATSGTPQQPKSQCPCRYAFEACDGRWRMCWIAQLKIIPLRGYPCLTPLSIGMGFVSTDAAKIEVDVLV
ncbi:hypothetical protein NPIL_25471 [Nephila pilipes]|uniref:Uncharacterized protein n=1 Tax=Nephila pilipes TaxID=299642 RepID=A0A8X6QV66_NEPPI|nr:hypothetical protein NPIL_25471 [Nephila pilipes]